MTDPREAEAREVLAIEYERHGWAYAARDTRVGTLEAADAAIAAMLAFADREREAMREACAVTAERIPLGDTDKLLFNAALRAGPFIAAAIRNLPSSKGSEG